MVANEKTRLKALCEKTSRQNKSERQIKFGPVKKQKKHGKQNKKTFTDLDGVGVTTLAWQ